MGEEKMAEYSDQQMLFRKGASGEAARAGGAVKMSSNVFLEMTLQRNNRFFFSVCLT